MSVPLDFRTTNTLWASVLVETLVRGGVVRAVVSPGSRSTPLAVALARHPGIKAVPVLDERSASFFALGLAKAGHQPVVLVCTSGTAGANYFPAVIEAQESGVPLLVLTADRPPEMRACASGQTIDQQKLFGNHVNFYHELALPEGRIELLQYLRQTVAHALRQTQFPVAGPVHLNVPFRDPLAPAADGSVAALESFPGWGQFFAHLAPAGPVAFAGDLPLIAPDGHGLIVVGPGLGEGADRSVAAVAEIARRLGWPVLTDGLSPLRNSADSIPQLVTTYDLVLRNPTVAERLQPERVLILGGLPTSKVLRAWLAKSDAVVWVVGSRPDNLDPLHGRTPAIPMDLVTLAAALPVATDPNGYTGMWARYEAKARAALDEALAAKTELFEGKAAWLLAQHLPTATPLFVANSMPVRDVEYFWPANRRGHAVFASRGANGIDGTLSTALGVAEGCARPAVLLTGDLALLHDTNGFLLRPKFRGSLTVVLINNAGGGIFEHLPIAQHEPPFEEFFATPQQADFGRLCAAYGVEHVAVRDWAHFTELIAALPAQGLRVLEIRTERKADAAWRKQHFAALAATLG